MSIESKIEEQINTNNVIIYMKGTPQFPMCGFSAKAVACLKHLNASFSYVNILEHPEIRATLPKVANWPTFPQLYIQQELIGGCDIILELFDNNELYNLLNTAKSIGEKCEAQEVN